MFKVQLIQYYLLMQTVNQFTLSKNIDKTVDKRKRTVSLPIEDNKG